MLNERTVRHIAQLARIELDEVEMASLTKDLQSILEYVRKLEEVDISGVSPLAHVTGRENVMREDVLPEHLENSTLLPNLQPGLLKEQAPGHEDGAIKVPRVLQQ